MTMSVAARPRPALGQCAAVGGAPLIRVRPAPSFEPPYDDERPENDEPPYDNEPPYDHELRDDDRLYDDEPRRSGAHPPRPAGPVGGLPPRAGTGGQAAYRYVGLCLEVLDGFRPAAHLRRLTLPAAFASVLEQLARPAARAGHASSAAHLPGSRATASSAAASPAAASSATAESATAGSVTVGPVRRARPAGNPRRVGGPGSNRLRLRRLWVGEPSHGVVEAAAVLGQADRAWALALRLERREETWLCTDLQVI